MKHRTQLAHYGGVPIVIGRVDKEPHCIDCGEADPPGLEECVRCAEYTCGDCHHIEGDAVYCEYCWIEFLRSQL